MAKNDRTLGIITHLLGIITWFIGALVVYLVADDKFTKNQAREALNWQLSALLYSAILAITIVGLLLIWVVGLLNIIFCIIAAIKANDGVLWKYPVTIRFLK